MRVPWAPTVWCDGQLVPVGAVAIPALSLGAIYGLGLFETLRAYEGQPFALERHLARLRAAAAELELACPHLADDRVIAHAVHAVLMANGLRDAAVRITLTAEGEDLRDPRATLIISARKFTGYPPRWYREGIRLAVAPWRRCARDLTVSLKSANYLTCLYARRWAQARGFDEALLLNCHGRVAEGAVSNIFAVTVEGVLVTPPVSEGLLAGITRQIVLELARQIGLEARQRPLEYEELLEADEVFVTNSLMELVPVRQVGSNDIRVCPGPWTQRLADAYRALTRP